MASPWASPEDGSWQRCATPRSSCTSRRANTGLNAKSSSVSSSTSRGEVVVATNDKLEEIVFTRVLRLNAVVQGLVFGLLTGGVIFIATNWLVLKGGRVVGPHLSLLNQFFIGYRVSFLGSLVGFAYGCVFGFAVGYVIAFVYNFAARARERRRTRRA